MTRRISSLLVVCTLAPCACVQTIIEADDLGSTATEDTGEPTESETGDGDGEPGDGDGDGEPGDGDGDGEPGDGDGDPQSFRVVVIADPHVIGPGYTGADESVLEAQQRLLETRDKIATIDPPPDFVIVLGDLVHEAYESDDPIWYQTNDNAFAKLVEVLDGFPVPVYPLFGDSDYDVPEHTKQLSHELFGQFFARDPYYAVDHLGWRFVFANSQFGQTFDQGTLISDPEIGSFGAAQLTWIGEQLAAGKPTVLLSHFPLYTLAADEAPNNGVYPDLDSVLELEGDSLALILSGHDHKWSNLPAAYAAPHVVFGATYFDTDNFLLIEFQTAANQHAILDAGKVGWGTAEAETWVYDGQPMPDG